MDWLWKSTPSQHMLLVVSSSSVTAASCAASTLSLARSLARFPPNQSPVATLSAGTVA